MPDESPPDLPRRPRVAVVFGGRSGEHSISCVSAGSVIGALDPDRYDVVGVGITRDGRWVLEDGDPARLALGAQGELPSVAGEQEVSLVHGRGLVPAAPAAAPDPGRVSAPGDVPSVLGEVDVVFPVMHGPWGQDGTLQGLLEMAGVRYVGAGVLASAVGTDKHFMKQLFRAADLPVLPWVVVRERRWQRDPDSCREEVAALGYPVFVKPARAGSSMGITRVDTPGDLDLAVADALVHDPKVIVEAAAEGAREIEIGVLGRADGGTPDVSLPAEILVGDEHTFYDFEAKYLEESFAVPADVDDDLRAEVAGLARRAFEALDVEGLARVDFFVMPDGRVIVNEVETMPGFTALSMFPRMWAATGLDYPALVDRLVQLALARDTGLR